MRSFQGNGVQGNRGGLGKQPLSLAKKGISCELRLRLPRYARNDTMGCPSKASAMTVWDSNDKDGQQ